MKAVLAKGQVGVQGSHPAGGVNLWLWCISSLACDICKGAHTADLSLWPAWQDQDFNRSLQRWVLMT